MLLIDFEKARKEVLEILHSKVTTVTAVKVAIAMKNAAVDAVPVVRCKACKHQRKVWINDRRRKEKGYWIFYCDNEESGQLGADDDFCSYGERKE